MYWLISLVAAIMSSVTSQPQYVLLDMVPSSHGLLQNVLQKRARFRDYFNNQIQAGPGTQMIVSNLIASSINATLVGEGHPLWNRSDLFPTIMVGLSLFHGSGRNARNVWRRYFYNSQSPFPGKNPVLRRGNSMDVNFIYCATPKIQTNDIWKFSIFFNPFDAWVWILLAVAIILVSILAYSSLSRKIFFPVFLSTLSVLLGGISDLPVKRWGTSGLFCLWMLVCSILVTFYTGEMTSQVIIPSPEETIKKFEELEKQNYTLLYGDLFKFGIVNATSRNLRGFPPAIKVLERMIPRAIVRTTLGIDKNLAEALLSENGKASAVGWPLAMWMATYANLQISTREAKNISSKARKKRCYVGKELIPTGESYFSFLPPGNDNLARGFLRLEAAGIPDRWMQEFMAIVYSRRVQDRVKVISPTQMIQDGHTVMELTIEGKIATIFLLWMICLCVSLVAFVGELYAFSIGQTSVEPLPGEFL